MSVPQTEEMKAKNRQVPGATPSVVAPATPAQTVQKPKVDNSKGKISQGKTKKDYVPPKTPAGKTTEKKTVTKTGQGLTFTGWLRKNWGWIVLVAAVVVIIVLASKLPSPRDGDVINTPTLAPTIQVQSMGQVPAATETQVPTQVVAQQQSVADIKPVVLGLSTPEVVKTISGIAGGYVWALPVGTVQTSDPQAASNEEERTYHVYQQTGPDEVLAFVAEKVVINGVTYTAPNVGTSNQGAVVGLVLGQPGQNLTITLTNAELKTLTIPGGMAAWQAYITELAKFQSSTRSGAEVIIIGASQ